MAGGIELGTAYVQIVPSLRGASKSIEDQLGAVDAKRPGKKLGASLGDGIGEQFERSGVPRVKRTFSDALEQMGSAAQDLGGRLSSVGGALTMGLTLPLGAAAASAGAFALANQLVSMGLPRRALRECGAADVASAAAMMVEAVNAGTVAHIGSPAMDESAALALWAARTTKRDPARKQRVW